MRDSSRLQQNIETQKSPQLLQLEVRNNPGVVDLD